MFDIIRANIFFWLLDYDMFPCAILFGVKFLSPSGMILLAIISRELTVASLPMEWSLPLFLLRLADFL